MVDFRRVAETTDRKDATIKLFEAQQLKRLMMESNVGHPKTRWSLDVVGPDHLPWTVSPANEKSRVACTRLILFHETHRDGGR